MESHILNELLKKYADNTISAEEKDLLFRYLIEEPDLTEAREILGNEWDNSIAEQQMDDALSSKIFMNIIGTPATVQLKRNRYWNWMGWAAAALITILGATYFLNLNFDKSRHSPVIAKVPVSADHQKIVLSDGSTVVLNRNSKLEYPQHFIGSTREVTLSGEGYFDIRHDSKKPFIVHAGNLSTTVLGTAFNIRTVDHDHTIVVTVTRGKVRVSRENVVLGVLIPNQQITYEKAEPLPKIEEVTAEKVIEWQAKDIFFKDVTMQEAMKELSGRFNTKIVFSGDAGRTCRLTATFLKGESLKEILNVISAFNGAIFKHTPGEITVSGIECK